MCLQAPSDRVGAELPFPRGGILLSQVSLLHYVPIGARKLVHPPISCVLTFLFLSVLKPTSDCFLQGSGGGVLQ